MNLNRVYSYYSFEEEGVVNDLIRTIQSIRKHLKVKITDKLKIEIQAGRLNILFQRYEELIIANCGLVACQFNKEDTDEIQLKLYSVEL